MNDRPIFNAVGAPMRSTPATWEPPSGSSPYFGWMDDHGGLFTIRMDSIICVAPKDYSGRMMSVYMTTGQPVMISAIDGLHLMRRMGWTEMSLRKQLGAAS